MSENVVAEPVRGSEGASPRPSFFQEAADAWRRLPHKFLFLGLFAAWCALFHFLGNSTLGYTHSPSLFAWANNVYTHSEDDQHGLYMPIAVLVFLWIKRRELAEIAPRGSAVALAYFAVAILAHVVGFRLQQSRISVLAFILGLHALIGVVWGTQALKRTVFPIFLLLFSIPFGSVADAVTFELRILVTKVAVGLCHNVLGIEVYRAGSQILNGFGRAMYDVAPACSGMRSLVAMAALSVIYAFLNFFAVWRRMVLILSALPIALFANIFRIVVVILVGDTWGQQYGAMIENKFGFVTFAIAIGSMMAIGWLIRERSSAAVPAAARTSEAEAEEATLP